MLAKAQLGMSAKLITTDKTGRKIARFRMAPL
jgi:hypothetical protein